MTPHRNQQETAIARFAIIAPVVTRPLKAPELADVIRAILGAAHPLPSAEQPQTISRRTLGRWMSAYRAALPNGTVAALEALAPQGRSDKGQPRVFTHETLEEAIRLRQELNTRSTADILAHLPNGPKEATLAYHLRRRAATRKAITASGRAYPRYVADAPNITWQSDVTEGLWLPDPTDPTKRKEVHLMGFIDDHSRLVTHGEWYFKESLPCLFDCLKKAVIKYGVPARLYWDNGPIYRSKQVALVAARLGVKVTFSTPYAPEGKGKIERFWLTVAQRFMKEAAHAGIESLAELNQHFWAWLETYHRRVHGSTGMTPLDRWEAGANAIRRPHPADLAEAFLWEETRQVKKTGTLSLAGNEYRVSDAFVGHAVTVRYDPMDLANVRVYKDGVFVELAAPNRLTNHTHRKATPKKQDDKYLPLPSSKRLLDAQAANRQDTVGQALAPLAEPPGDRLTQSNWRRLLEETLKRGLVEPEGETAAHFFQRHAPMRVELIGEILRDVVERRGLDRHLAYYLAEIYVALTGGQA
jgi:putative transposase